MTVTVIEEGLKKFCSQWEQNASRIMSFRTEAILNKNLLLRVENGPSYILRIRPLKAEFTSGEGECVNASITMSQGDWAAVLSGEYNIDSVAFAGRCHYPRHERRLIRQLGFILQTTLLLEEEDRIS